MSTVLQGKSTFALGKVIRRLTAYLEKWRESGYELGGTSLARAVDLAQLRW